MKEVESIDLLVLEEIRVLIAGREPYISSRMNSAVTAGSYGTNVHLFSQGDPDLGTYLAVAGPGVNWLSAAVDSGFDFPFRDPFFPSRPA